MACPPAGTGPRTGRSRPKRVHVRACDSGREAMPLLRGDEGTSTSLTTTSSTKHKGSGHGLSLYPPPCPRLRWPSPRAPSTRGRPGSPGGAAGCAAGRRGMQAAVDLLTLASQTKGHALWCWVVAAGDKGQGSRLPTAAQPPARASLPSPGGRAHHPPCGPALREQRVQGRPRLGPHGARRVVGAPGQGQRVQLTLFGWGEVEGGYMVVRCV